MTAVDEVSDRYVAEFARLDPCTAALMGIAGQESALTDYSPQGWAERRALTTATLAELARTPLHGDADRISARVLTERLQADQALADAGVPDADLNIVDGPLQLMRLAIEVLDQGAGTRWDLVLDRLRALPAALAGVQVSLAEAARQGRVAAQRQVQGNARQAEQTAAFLQEFAARYGAHAEGRMNGNGRADLSRGITSGGGDGPDGGARRLGVESAAGRSDERLADALRAAAGASAGALADFGAFLTGELLPRAPRRDALGRDRYQLEVRNHLGTTLDLEETYAWGWEELARLDARMQDLAAQILPGRPLADVFAALDADPAHQVACADAFRDHLQQLADTTIDRLHGVHFDIPGPLRRIECRIPPTKAGGVYYLAPSEDLSRPGQVWWTLPDVPSGIPVWTVPATMYHEGVPGHHLQLGTTVLSTSLNRFRRMSAELHPGHAEGWALYAERLMGELGFYSDPAHELGMLAGGQQLRAARVVLDIGLHLELPIPKGAGFHEGERWNRDLGLAFLRQRLPRDESAVVFEIDRYLGKPAQAIAYKVGERVWLQARDAARHAQGPAFELKAFHQAALDLGAMGLDLLHTELARLSAPAT